LRSVAPKSTPPGARTARACSKTTALEGSEPGRQWISRLIATESNEFAGSPKGSSALA
jgi:hypothetical protein